MSKKKAIKIATASAIAASAFAGVPAIESQAATNSVDKAITKATNQVNKAFNLYYNTTKKSNKLPSGTAIRKEVKLAEQYYAAAQKEIAKNGGSKTKKAAYTKKLEKSKTSLNRAKNYVAAISVTLKASRTALATAVKSGNETKILSAAKALDAKIVTFEKAVKKVYGPAARTVLTKTYTTPAKAESAAAYKAVLKVTSVAALDETNKYLQIKFNTKVSSLTPADIQIKDAKKGTVYGVKAVTLAADGKSAQLELFENTENGYVLKPATQYTVTVKANGKTLTSTFVDAGYLDERDNARVTKVDSKKRQITVSHKGGTVTLDVPADSDLNFQEALGQVVRVWYDGEDNLIRYQYDTEKVIYDAIKFDKTNRIKTVDEEVKYDIAANAQIIINDGATSGSSQTADASGNTTLNGNTYAYAKVVLNDSGEAERIYAYTVADNPIVVQKTDGNYIYGYDKDELDTKDFRIVNAEGKQIKVSDIKTDDLVIFNEDVYAKDGLAVVLNNTTKGAITKVYDNSFDFGGKTYKYTNGYGNPVKYLNEDGDFENLRDTEAKQLQAGGDVKLYFDLQGELLYVIGNVADINTNLGALYLQDKIAAYADAKLDGSLEFDGINSTGKVETYDFKVDTLDKITVQTGTAEVKYEVNKLYPGLTGSANEIDEFAISTAAGSYTRPTSSAPIANGVIVALNDAGAYIGDVVALNAYATPNPLDAIADGVEHTNNVIKVGKDSNNKVNSLEFNTAAVDLAADIDEKDNYANGKKLQDSTLVYDVSRSNKFYDADEDDVEVTTWGQLKKNGVDIKAGDAKVYYNDDNEVTALVTYNDSVANDDKYTALITSASYSDGKLVRISALVNGEKKTYEVKDSSAAAVAEGDIAVINVNAAGTIVSDIAFASATSRFVTGEVTAVSVGQGTVTVNGTEYKLGTNGKVYDAKDADGDDYEVQSLRDIAVGESVALGLSATGSTFVDVVAEVNSADYAPLVIDADRTSATTFTVTFSESVDATTAQNLANYTLLTADPADNSAVTGAVLGADKRTVTITAAGANIVATDTVTVSNVKDLAGVTMTASPAIALTVE